MSENLTTKTVQGIKWNSVSTITNAVVQLGYSAIMARLLAPSDFGLMAMSGLVLGFSTYFSQMGMSQALINKKDLYKEDIRVAFTSSFLLGILFSGITWLAAPLSVYIFDNPQLVPILRTTCISLVINGLGSTSISLLRRNLEFKSVAIIQIASYLVGYVLVGMSLAYLDFGVWSLVAASICQAIISTVTSYIFARHSLSLLFDWKYYQPLFAFGSKMSLISFIDFLGADFDTLFIGRFLGEANLGLYNRAFILIRQPVSLLVGTVSRVLFPAFSRIQTEISRLKNVYLFSVSSVALIIFPICCGISLAAEPIVYLMLGEKWTAAIPILQVLAFTTPFRVLMHFSGIVCDATGTLTWKAMLHISYFLVLGILFFAFKPLGLIGCTYAVLLAAILKNVGYFLILRKVLGLKLGELLKAYRPGFFSAIVLSIGLYVTSMLLESFYLPNLLELIVLLTVGLLFWLVSLYFTPDKGLLAQLSQKFNNRPTSKKSNSPLAQLLTKVLKVITHT
ncbi:lipopolysaccharide biosynthesis protein [Rhodocytophaga aerolata]|uniref:Lipopolysaccharide biosynthesis protein n=1 Tax=Rhodocytophaga aerolata TaxID=455078 RepID=A0ABT8RBK5_9BACT|nr:lipopolysaccharide biosynthesis protein [Rhodocytophaga aerolata]MDO1449474.1 lipopolysaccharide biosynthesis protein [Rhodocytophaga aerolata]